MDRAHRLARSQEKVTARLHAGRLTPGSGSGAFDKNDVTNEEWSIEVKSTTQKGYRLTLETWITTENQALEQGKNPVMVIAFMPLNGRAKRLVVLEENDFIERESSLKTYRDAVNRLDDENWKLWNTIQELESNGTQAQTGRS